MLKKRQRQGFRWGCKAQVSCQTLICNASSLGDLIEPVKWKIIGRRLLFVICCGQLIVTCCYGHPDTTKPSKYIRFWNSSWGHTPAFIWLISEKILLPWCQLNLQFCSSLPVCNHSAVLDGIHIYQVPIRQKEKKKNKVLFRHHRKSQPPNQSIIEKQPCQRGKMWTPCSEWVAWCVYPAARQHSDANDESYPNEHSPDLPKEEGKAAIILCVSNMAASCQFSPTCLLSSECQSQFRGYKTSSDINWAWAEYQVSDHSDAI